MYVLPFNLYRVLTAVCMFCVSSQLMECCVNALVTSFKETILAECPGMIKRNETVSEYFCTVTAEVNSVESHYKF